jgi:light-regulated signal transduction histidine kinase (bacteriophytochrome)
MRILSVVRENTNILAQCIDDMQAFARKGRMAMAPTEVDLQALVRNGMEELESARAGRNMNLEIGILSSVYAERPMLRQVFMKLLSNAIKFTYTREAPVIQVGCSSEGEVVVCYVKDKGVGFDMKYVDKLFGVFRRLHSVSEFEGTGIDLAIVKRIVSRHGGRVWAESVVDRGARFFSLPHAGIS